MKRWYSAFLMCVVMAMIALLPMQSASADDHTYVAEVTKDLGTAVHVFSDVAADPKLSPVETAALNRQIIDLDIPVYVLVLDDVRVRGTKPADLARTIYAHIDTFRAIIAVSTGDGFYARGFNMPRSLMPVIRSKARQSEYDSIGGLYSTINLFINRLPLVESRTVVAESEQTELAAAQVWPVIAACLVLASVVALGIWLPRRHAKAADRLESSAGRFIKNDESEHVLDYDAYVAQHGMYNYACE